jgi:endonuclease/exonuclease/phosphatase family metal-dependent hydrolase
MHSARLYRDALINADSLPDESSLTAEEFIQCWLDRVQTNVKTFSKDPSKLNAHLNNNFYSVGPVRMKDFTLCELQYLAMKVTCNVYEFFKRSNHNHIKMPTAELETLKATVQKVATMNSSELQKHLLDSKRCKKHEYKKFTRKERPSVEEAQVTAIESSECGSSVSSTTSPEQCTDAHSSRSRDDESHTADDAVNVIDPAVGDAPNIFPDNVKIVFWNSLKLGIMSDEICDDYVRRHYGKLIEWLRSHDVIALTEITSGVGKARVRRLASLLSNCTANKTWQVHFSEESLASSSSRGSKEMHAVIYNSKWNIVNSNTLHRIESGGSITHMGHAPLVVQFNSTMEHAPLQSFSLIVAHLAPSSRSRTRNQEAKALFRRYAETRDLRFDSFEDAAHILCGDFNMHPEAPNGVDDMSLTRDLWTSFIPPTLSTMATSKNTFDNILCNRWLTTRFTIHAHVQPLNRLPDGRPVSDHYPVSLTMSSAQFL